MLRDLAAISDRVVLTQVTSERSAHADEILRDRPDLQNCQVILDPRDALGDIIENSEDSRVILVTGSLFLIGELRPLFFDSE